MTLQELSDNFQFLEKIQARLHKTESVTYQEGILAQWISEAQNQIAALVGMLETDTTLTLVNGQTLYDLPADFKAAKLVSIPAGSIPANVSADQNVIVPPNYTPSDITHVKAQQALGVDDFTYVIVWDNDNDCWAIEFVMTPVGAPVVHYTFLPGVYSPSGPAEAAWGKFNGNTYYGDSIIGDEYEPAIKYYMLGEVFPDLRARFKEEAQLLLRNKMNTAVTPFRYNFANVRR